MVNINDVCLEESDQYMEGDMLTDIFDRQHELMEAYHPIEARNGLLLTDEVPVNLHSAIGQARLKDFAWRITEELGEAMNCLKNKPWKQTQMETDIAHYQEELADAFHFFIELCILSGIDAIGLYNLYFRKNKVNQFRQRSKY
jgi:predicted HAD superfamily Cof-like phosphohydrolase